MDIISNGNHWLLILTLSTPRFLAIFVMLPFLGKQFIPTMLRNGIAIFLTIPVLPVVENEVIQFSFDESKYLIIILKELTLGIVIGYLVSIIFWAIASSGTLIDMQRGAMSAQMFNPIVSGQTSTLGSFLSLAAVTYLFLTGGFLVLLSSIYKTYLIWPVTAYYPSFTIESATFFLNQFDSILYIALLLSAPILILMFVTELGVALIGRFVPSINVFILAMPLKSIVAFLILSIYAASIIFFLKESFISFNNFDDVLGIVFK